MSTSDTEEYSCSCCLEDYNINTKCHKTIDGNVCDNCIDNYDECYTCKELVYNDKTIYYQNLQRSYCENCAEQVIYSCDRCEEQFDIEIDHYHTFDKKIYCNSCFGYLHDECNES